MERVRHALAAPVFADDEDKTRLASVLNPILLVIAALTGLFLVASLFTGRSLANLAIEGTLILMSVGLLWLQRRGHVRLAAFLLSLALWIIVTAGSWFSGGLRGSGLSSYFGIILIGGLLLGGRGGLLFGGLSMAAGVILLYGETSGLMPPLPGHITSPYILMEFSTVVAGVTGLLYLATRSLNNALEHARRNARAQAEANRELQALRTTLEAQIASRTRELEQHTARLEASAEVSRSITSILDAEALVHEVTELIGTRFGLYHVALFTLDETGHWANYQAGSGEIGQLLKEQGLRLEATGRSLVGRCMANAQACASQDLRAESQRAAHTLLSKTRSEAALPLIARGRVIGALDAHSEQAGTFDQDTLAVLQSLADQVAVALDNARLFAERQAALEVERRAYGEISREAWVNLLRASPVAGYSYVDEQVRPISPSAPQAAQAQPSLSVPIAIRGQVIGYVDLYKGSGGEWTAEERALLETLTEQLGLALDSARLYQDTQRRAATEQLIGKVTSHMRETLDVEAVLKTAADEMFRALGLDEVVVRLAIEPEPQEQA